MTPNYILMEQYFVSNKITATNYSVLSIDLNFHWDAELSNGILYFLWFQLVEWCKSLWMPLLLIYIKNINFLQKHNLPVYYQKRLILIDRQYQASTAQYALFVLTWTEKTNEKITRFFHFITSRTVIASSRAK